MAFQITGKEIYPVFVFAKYCWSVHSKMVKLGQHAHSREKPLPHNLCNFMSNLCAHPAS